MAPSTRKRKAAIIDPFDSPNASKKRLRTLRPRKDAIHPFTELPSELQLRIMGFCDSKTLSAFSLLSNHFRELSLRVMWETQPVETYIKNFDQLDEHEDLRLAVRHLAIRKQSAPNRSRFSGVAKRLVTRFPRNYFPGLQEFTIEYETAASDYFVTIINTLSKYQPKRLKTINIHVIYRWRALNSTINKDPPHSNIIYPTGLTTVNLECKYTGQTLVFDPMKVFDANSGTVTTAKAYLGAWYNHFSLKPCPNVTTLYAKQDQYDRNCAKDLSKKFPNTERLILTAPSCGVLWPGADLATLMEKYADWRYFSRAKFVELTYSHGVRYGRNDVDLRDSILKNTKFLVRRWISDGEMPELEEVQVMRFEPLKNMTNHSFTFQIEIKEARRVVVTSKITKLPDEIKLEKEKEEKERAEKETEKKEKVEKGVEVKVEETAKGISF
ncbi:hypothetical protein TWF106_009267 [Orbilia oligospora]|uniref:F-box domain-containing protein n=1 Tax=Orbilia oligospora TaxID=2813651 RepID=A0A7C8UKS7_ORBOL|nr:hypothetical protein TWF106_009267 [Orbilia oligospora]